MKAVSKTGVVATGVGFDSLRATKGLLCGILLPPYGDCVVSCVHIQALSYTADLF